MNFFTGKRFVERIRVPVARVPVPAGRGWTRSEPGSPVHEGVALGALLVVGAPALGANLPGDHAAPGVGTQS